MGDNSPGDSGLRVAWRAFGHRAAAGTGALTALVSILSGASVQSASVRGAGAWLALVVLARIGGWLVERTHVEATPVEADRGEAR